MGPRAGFIWRKPTDICVYRFLPWACSFLDQACTVYCYRVGRQPAGVWGQPQGESWAFTIQSSLEQKTLLQFSVQEPNPASSCAWHLLDREAVVYIFFLSFFSLRFYLFIWQRETQLEREHKQGEREREKQASRWAGSPTWGSIPGPRDHDPSRRQMLNDCATQATPYLELLIFLVFFISFIKFGKFSGIISSNNLSVPSLLLILLVLPSCAYWSNRWCCISPWYSIDFSSFFFFSCFSDSTISN